MINREIKGPTVNLTGPSSPNISPRQKKPSRSPNNGKTKNRRPPKPQESKYASMQNSEGMVSSEEHAELQDKYNQLTREKEQELLRLNKVRRDTV
jgi:hypothetical protein